MLEVVWERLMGTLCAYTMSVRVTLHWRYLWVCPCASLCLSTQVCQWQPEPDLLLQER